MQFFKFWNFINFTESDVVSQIEYIREIYRSCKFTKIWNLYFLEITLILRILDIVSDLKSFCQI